MAQPSQPSQEPPFENTKSAGFWRRIFGRDNGPSATGSSSMDPQEPSPEGTQASGLIRRVSRRVVPGLPRAQTFKRQQSELRDNLVPTKPTPDERRTLSVDRRLHPLRNVSNAPPLPRTSAPDFIGTVDDAGGASIAGDQLGLTDEKQLIRNDAEAGEFGPDVEITIGEQEDESKVPSVPVPINDAVSTIDTQSITTSQYDAMIHEELEHKWILNLSMHFRDKSKREKFFVTYRERDTLWRRVTISLDYRHAPDSSLEMDLTQTKFQRDKSAKIYEAIRESLQDIQFYDTVTNLKLQTTDGRLHVHVVEDVNEIIHYPDVRMVQHLGCRLVREKDIHFDSHMSGFVYKVRVNGQILIKKEIPGPDTVDEFLYEVNALNCLQFSDNIIDFYGVIVDDQGQSVKGLLISYAEQGALVDVVFDHEQSLPWISRAKWSRQIVQGLSDIHEAGFVQGDFTLSNIVIDRDEDAKIIDINRRGCPVGWEPPEATPLIDSNQRISMYIGVKSDLYQLGMVLWALATQEDEPETRRRPLRLEADVTVPMWYRRIVEVCLSEDPRDRLQATALLAMFPETLNGEDNYRQDPASISVDDGYSLQEYYVDGSQPNNYPRIRTVHPPTDWSYVNMGHTYATSPGLSDYYPPRGRSPPSPLPSHHGQCETPYKAHNVVWPDNNVAPSDSVADAMFQSNRDAIADSQNAVVGKEKTTEDSLNRGVDVSEQSITDAIHPVSPKLGSAVEQAATDSSCLPQSLGLATPESRLRNTIDNISLDSTDVQIRTTEPEGIQFLDIPVQQQHEDASQTGMTAPEDREDWSRGGMGESRESGGPLMPEQLPIHKMENENDADLPGKTSNRLPEQVPLPTSPEPQTWGSPTLNIPNDLKGIGSAYDQEEEIRQVSCSDEDLGLTATTTATAEIYP